MLRVGDELPGGADLATQLGHATPMVFARNDDATVRMRDERIDRCQRGGGRRRRLVDPRVGDDADERDSHEQAQRERFGAVNQRLQPAPIRYMHSVVYAVRVDQYV